MTRPKPHLRKILGVWCCWSHRLLPMASEWGIAAEIDLAYVRWLMRTAE